MLETPSIQESKRYEMYANGRARILLIYERAVATNPRSIVIGIKSRMRMLAGRATSETCPME
jgi:hypothetical protein